MLGNGIEMSLFSAKPWAPYHFVVGAQLAPGEKRLVCIPEAPHLRLTQTNCSEFSNSESCVHKTHTKNEMTDTLLFRPLIFIPTFFFRKRVY